MRNQTGAGDAGEGRRLTADAIAALHALGRGEHIAYSQDGEVGWLWPSRKTLDDADIWALRDAGYIANAPYDEDEHVRFGPPDVITDLGLAALTETNHVER